MAIDTNLVKLAVDGYHGRMAGDYSVNDSQETLRKAMVEANGGSSVLNYKNIRDGKCVGLFSIVEELVNAINEEGLKGDELFNQLVDDRNLALGDSNQFHVVRNCLFTVSDIAEGTQGARRQRIEAGQDITINTQLHAIKIYEELNRVLSGRVDFNEFVNAVGRSFTQYDLDCAYAAFVGMIDKVPAPYAITGSFDEDKLLDLAAHIEASTGGTAMIYGTKKALRKITTAVMSDQAKNDIYGLGYMGRVDGIPMVSLAQRHKVGTTDFILDDNALYVFSSTSGKPIKRVTEGEVTMLMGDPTTNADLSQQYLMTKRTGIGVVLDREYGVYKMA